MVHFARGFLASFAAAAATSADATSVTITNLCTYPINLFDNKAVTPLAPGANTFRALPNGYVGMFRHGANDQATLGEISVDAGTGRPWYDISIIPPGPGNCGSYAACKAATGKVGYNVPMQITPKTNVGSGTCTTLTCMFDGCPDAYLYPADDTKTHNCPSGTDFDLTFCPGGTGGATPAPTPAPTPSPTPAPSPEPTTPAPTPPPTTAEPTPTPTMTPPIVLLTQMNGSSNGSRADDEPSAGVAKNEDAVVDLSGVGAPTTPPPTQAATVIAAPSTDEGTVQANTKSSQGSSSSAGLVVALVVGAVAMTAGAVIVVIRKKKLALEQREQKSPMNTPARGDHALAAYRSNDVSQL